MGHLKRLGVMPETNGGRYLLDWQWMCLRREDPDLQYCHPALLMQSAYTVFGNKTTYWRVGTDERTERDLIDRWPDMKVGGFASIGWGFLGDLNDLLAGMTGIYPRERLREVLASHREYRAKPPQVIGRWAVQIMNFYAAMRPGDRIVAMKGNQLLGLGEVVGKYEYAEDDLQPHHRAVRWYDISPELWPSAPGLQTTVYDFTERHAEALHVERLLLSNTPLSSIEDRPPYSIDSSEQDSVTESEQVIETTQLAPDPVPLTAQERRIKDILDRKGQVILYGPPGTGKTYTARQSARELIARERCGGRAWAMLSESERDGVDKAIEFVTFHPAYAYEDFIEGYRPSSGGNAGMTFELRNGLFLEACERARKTPDWHHILVIDEINRGNVAAVLGELITLLESDKRDSLRTTLPVSRRPFCVPANLWIIGTMNTADRSISLLDTALRRRFGFVELLPEPEHVAVDLDGLSLSALLTEINVRIRKYITRNARELQVGHAYLMRAGLPLQSKEDLLAAFRDDILPLLAEYCFENYTALARIVGDKIIDIEQQIPSPCIMFDPMAMHKALLRLVSADPVRVTELGDTEEEGTETALEELLDGDLILVEPGEAIVNG
jgi:5-methylcytosine-specific restriction protein B